MSSCLNYIPEILVYDIVTKNKKTHFLSSAQSISRSSIQKVNLIIIAQVKRENFT